MGNCCIRQHPNAVSSKNVTVAVLGLDDAGKTVTAKVLKGDPPDEVVPTIGFTNIQFNFKKHNISMFDLGGGSRIRDIWTNYFAEVHGLIFVLDSSHRERIEECREVLLGVVQDVRIKGKPMLVLGNKQDINGAMDSSEICDLLKLDALANNFESLCRIECCSALKQQKGRVDRTIVNGFQWLLDAIDTNWSTLKDRVEKDVADQKERERIIRLERAERVRKLREEREKAAAESGELKDAEDEIDGSPFKPLDTYQFSKKDEDDLSKRNDTNHSSLKSTLNIETYLVKSDQGTERKSPEISNLVVSEDRTDKKVNCGYSELYDESECGDNGKHRLDQESSTSVPLETLNFGGKRALTLPANVLPPLEIDVERGEKKKKRRRQKRNRVAPMTSDTEDVHPPSAQNEPCAGNDVHGDGDEYTRNSRSVENDLHLKNLPLSYE